MAKATASTALWRCPRCGAGFVNANQWHSCRRHDLDALFTGRPAARRLFDAFLRHARLVGPFEVIPQKTRVAFLAKTRFAGVPRVGKDFIIIGFGLPRRIASPRIAKVERVQRWVLHYVRLTRPDQLDGALLGWLRESYEQMGLRRYLTRPRPPRTRSRQATRPSGSTPRRAPR